MTLGCAVVYFNIMAQRVFWLNFLCFSDVFHHSGHFGLSWTISGGLEDDTILEDNHFKDSWELDIQMLNWALWWEKKQSRGPHHYSILWTHYTLLMADICEIASALTVKAEWVLVLFIPFSYQTTCLHGLSFQRNTNTVHSVWLNYTSMLITLCILK